MPRVEPPSSRPLLQALVVRLHDRGIRLVVESVTLKGDVDYGDPSWIVEDRAVPKRVKGSDGHLSSEERELIDDHQPQLKTMLRFDFDYATELVRDVHYQLREKYPLGRGCDLSQATTKIEEATTLLDDPKPWAMHDLWVLLDAALKEGLRLCEEGRKNPLLRTPDAREEALRG